MIEKTFRFCGPAFLLCNLAFLPEIEFLIIGLVGFGLCTFWKTRGCALSLLLLCGLGLLRHSSLELGIEASLALTFFITALVAEREDLAHQSLMAQMEARTATLQHIEDELAKAGESAVKTQFAFSEKIGSLQKELEELQADYSSILILNEVLRQTSARQEEFRYKNEDLLREIAALKQELDRPLASQNADLMKELNAARVAQEQTHLINETLARLYARENLKVKEAEQEIISLKEQLRAPKAHNPMIVDQLAYAKEKLTALLQIEPKYRQLREQFEERNEVLHQTRAQLFKIDTEVQKLEIEKEQILLNHNPVPDEILAELARLEEENQHLEELVTHLTDESKVKKKVKTKSVPDNSPDLF